MTFNSEQEKFVFYKIPAFLFSVLPALLITGPFLSDVSISIISIIFFSYCIKKKNFSFFNNKYFYFFLLFWLYLIFNTLINNFNYDSLKISFFFFRYGIFVIGVAALMEVDAKFIKYFFYCILFCFVALIIDGFYQYYNVENLIGWKTISDYRISSFFGDELILGSYLSRLWPIFFGLSILLFKKSNYIFYLFILTFILSEVLIFLSGERVAFFYINLSALFVIIFSNKLLKLRLTTLIISLFLILIISQINPTAKNRIIDKTISQMNLSTSNTKSETDYSNKNEKYIFSKQHTHLYITAYKMFLDNKILGVGVKNFRNFCGDKKYEKSELSCSTHPHNTYIQILSETGILGFIFLIFISIYFCTYIMKHLIYKLNRKLLFNDFEICVLSGILLYLWPVAPTGNVFNNWLTIIMVLNLPFLIWSRKLNKFQ